MPPLMNWPDNECPNHPGTSARELLETIITLAQADGAYNFTEILNLSFKCLLNTPGGPPDNDLHCLYVEKAFFFAQNGVWFKVADELNHGHV